MNARRRNVGLALGLITMVVIAWRLTGGLGHDPEPFSPDPLPNNSIIETGIVLSGPNRVDGAGARNEVESELHRTEVFVRESTFDSPVEGWARWAGADARRWFHNVIAVDHRPETDLTIEVDVAGAEPLLIERSTGTSPEVIARVTPAREATVHVVNLAGEPLDGFVLRWHDPSLAEGRIVETQTRSGGVGSLPTLRPVVVQAGSSRRTVHPSVNVAPGGSVTLVVPQDSHVLRFVSGEPERIGGHQVTLRFEGDLGWTPWTGRLPNDGVVVVPADAGSITIELGRPGLEFIEDLGAGWVRRKSDVAHLLHLEPGGETVVAVRDATRTLRLVDADTGEGLTCDVRWIVRRAELDGAWRSASWSTWQAIEGRMRFYEIDMSRYAPERERYFVKPHGYHELEIENVQDLMDPSQEELTLAFQRCAAHTLRIVDRNDAPWQTTIRLRLLNTGEVIHRLTVDAEGRYGPFDGTDEPLLVIEDGADTATSPGMQHPNLGVLSASNRTEDGGYLLVVDRSVGGLQVNCEGAPPVPIFAQAKQHDLRYRPTSTDGEAIRFDGLPPGTYNVGPAPWLRGLRSLRHKSLGALDIEIEPGRRTTLAWDARWATRDPLRGRVQLPPDTGMSFHLIPMYGTTTTAHAIGTGSQRIGVDKDGRYEISVNQPVPEILLLATLPHLGGDWGMGNQDLWIHGDFRPGQNFDPSLAALRLRDPKDLAVHGLEIEAEVGRARFTADGQRVCLAWRDEFWAAFDGPADGRVVWVPAGIHEFELRSGKRSWTQSVVLRAGDVVDLELLFVD